MTTLITEKDALAFFQAKIEQLDKAIAAQEQERNALGSLLDAVKKTETTADYPKQRSLPSIETEPKKTQSSAKKSNNKKKTASDYLKDPNLGVKGSILRMLKKKDQQSSNQIIQEIADIDKSDPHYKKVANSIRQSLRSAVEAGDLQQYRSNGSIVYTLRLFPKNKQNQ